MNILDIFKTLPSYDIAVEVFDEEVGNTYGPVNVGDVTYRNISHWNNGKYVKELKPMCDDKKHEVLHITLAKN